MFNLSRTVSIFYKNLPVSSREITVTRPDPVDTTSYLYTKVRIS